MYRVKIVQDFSGAHNLREYEGKCENLHGHNWKVEAVLKCDKLDKIGMLVDFKVFKAELNKILSYLDHVYINETPPFDNINPTSENLAKYIFDELDKVFPGMPYLVSVWESRGSCAEYCRD